MKKLLSAILVSLIGLSFCQIQAQGLKSSIIRAISPGWNWFSINVDGPDLSIGNVLGSLSLSDGDYIKNKSQSATWYNGFGWFGDLTEIIPGEMYKLKKAHADGLNFDGEFTDPCTPIPVQTGWNWIGFIPQTVAPIAEALASINPMDGDYIKSQDKSATYYNGFGWFGELTEMEPGEGYMLKTNHEEILIYPECGSGCNFVDIRDGREYECINLGTQTWMAENLAWLPAVSPSSSGSDADSYYYVYGYEGSNVATARAQANYSTYGALYNWPAALASCPPGWHLPDDNDWKTLEKQLGMSDSDANDTQWRNSGDVGVKLKSTSGWISDGNGDNSSGMSVLPAGRHNNTGGFGYLNLLTHFWSASGNSSSKAWYRYMIYNEKGVYRFYDDRSFGFSVRCVKGIAAPIVVSSGITDIDHTNASGGGNVISDGGAPVTARGICWSTAPSPTILTGNFTVDGSGMGSFSSSMSGLEAGKMYYVRAFAMNGAGTSYGNQVTFTTSNQETGTFKDSRDGKEYNWVQIGYQAWMAENIAWLPSVSPSSIGSEADEFYYVYGYEGTNVTTAKAQTNYSTHGVLYNWIAATTACPDDWRLPTDLEWKVMEKYLGMNESDANNAGWRNTGDVGRKLKSTSGWSNGDNSSGFTALPSGRRNSAGSFGFLGTLVHYWSNTKNGSSNSWYRYLIHNEDGVYRNYDNRSYGFPVRCVKGAEITIPEVTTTGITEIAMSSAMGGGTVISDGGTPIAAHGVCWSTSPNPTISNFNTKNGSGTGAYPSLITGLAAHTKYYVRAYATSIAGTGYGGEVSFTTKDASGTFTDSRDGNDYDWVTIGDQVWMAENLAWLPSVNPSSVNSDVHPLYYVHGYQGTIVPDAKNHANYSTYGVLYNRQAAISACPDGWHLPSGLEWIYMEVYLGMSSSDAYDLGWRNSGDVGKKLKSTDGWLDDGNGDNSSWFDALPGGFRNSIAVISGFYSLGYESLFWSSSKSDPSVYPPWGYGRKLSFEQDGIEAIHTNLERGISVRCVKD